MLADFEGYTYLFASDALGWEQARQACLNRGFALASIESLAEYEFIKSNIIDQQCKHELQSTASYEHYQCLPYTLNSICSEAT